jgi:hypothetical protein
MTSTSIDPGFQLGALAMILYLYNTGGVRFVEDIFGPDVHETYMREKASTYSQSPARAIAGLDSTNMKKLVELAVSRHGDAAREIMSCWRLTT